MRPGFRMTIGADLGEVAGVNAAFSGFADAHGLPASIRRSVNVALDELLTNTISYGFAGRGGGQVTIEAELGADRLSVTVTDDGRPFDPLGVASPDTALPVEQRKIGGLGLHLVRRLMDDVSYERRADRNVVVLAKRLASGKTGSRQRKAHGHHHPNAE
jgi:anti-sigma regulatory factor (Ser/Thr protein kinase)